MGSAGKTVTRVATAGLTGGLSEVGGKSGGIAGLSNIYGEFSGANAAARAAQDAANASAAASREERALQLREGNRAKEEAERLAKATPQELRAYGEVLKSSQAQLAQREKQIAAIDPALMEASSQVLKLLRGEQAGSTQAAMGQRQAQRQALVNQLRSQYGPGAESSSLGQKRLQTFDAETNMLTQNLQQSALSQVFGIAGSAPGLTNRNSELSALTAAGQNYGGLQQRRLTANQNANASLMGALSGTSQGMINAAGAPYVGAAMQAQGQQQFFNQALNLGALAATGGFGGGAAKPTAGVGTQAGGSYSTFGAIA